MPLAEESQFLFAFEDPTQPASQLTWTVLSQKFRDSPHLFGQSLSRSLQNFNSSELVVLQYADDILLCAETASLFKSLRRFLKLSGRLWLQGIKRKGWLCQQSVTYLGLIISEGTRAIGPEGIKPILNQQPIPVFLPGKSHGKRSLAGYSS